MSHACIIVALSPEDLERAVKETQGQGKDTIEAAVSYQMAPFDENGEWGAEGTRWDWWTIGGRYTGKFSPPDYDPQTDPDNIQTCTICRGTGMRMDVIGIEHRKVEPTYKCNGCSGTGREVKWKLKDIYNIILRRDINLETLTKKAEARARSVWKRYEEEKSPNAGWIYGIEEDDTEESLVADALTKPLTAYAFLRNRVWNEQGRLGMFAMELKTECEIKAENEGKEYKGRCIFTRDDAKIITWSGPKDSQDLWGKMYYKRFIQELPDETLLVCVDYHV